MTRARHVPRPWWIDRALGAEAPLWVVVLLTVPIVVVGMILTTGLKLDGLPWMDNDYWWHLATGNWILDHHRVPTTDPFSWTHGGENWIAHEWLAELILAVTVRAGGYAGAISFTAILTVTGYWWLLSAARRYGLSRRAAVLLTVLWGSALARTGVIMVRPQAWTFALFGVLFSELAAYDTKHRRSLWVLPPLFVLWVNLNLTALIGIGCLGAFVLDRLLHRRLDRHLAVVSLLCLLALLVNPRGPELLVAVFKYQDPDAVRYSLVHEWMSPKLDDPVHLPFLLALPVAPFAAWQLLRLHIWPAAPVLLLLYESFKAIRFIPIFVMLSIVFAGWLVWRWAQDQGTRPALAPVPLVPRHPWVLAPPLLAAAVALAIALNAEWSQFRREPVPWGYPQVASTILLEDYPKARLFNVYDYGGFLINRFDGRMKVFVDGREEMYGDPFLRRYRSLIRGSQGWQQTFEDEGVDAVLVRHVDGLSNRLRVEPGWTEIYSDRSSVLYVRSVVAQK